MTIAEEMTITWMDPPSSAHRKVERSERRRPTRWGGWLEGIVPGMSAAGHGSALIAFALPG